MNFSFAGRLRNVSNRTFHRRKTLFFPVRKATPPWRESQLYRQELQIFVRDWRNILAIEAMWNSRSIHQRRLQ